MTTSFLQSADWATFQEKLGRTVWQRSGPGWSYMATLESGTGNTRLYTPYGPVATDTSALKAAIADLRALGAEQKVDFIRIEPTLPLEPRELAALGGTPVAYQQLQPAHTRIIDLAPSADELLAHMSQNSRNITRNYHKKGVVLHTSSDPKDITILTDLLAGVAHRNGIRPHSDAYFALQADTLMPRGSATLYYATLQDTPIAAALVYDSNTTRSYAHAAADDTYRKLSAGTAIVGQLILDAKQKGLKEVDLYGIAPTDDPTHPWAGFTKFKKSFGGRDVSFVGAWDVPLHPLRYRMYRLYQTIYRRLR